MSKYAPLWDAVVRDGRPSFTLTFDEIAAILGFPIDHSFLNCKKELLNLGYQAEKISLKKQTVCFRKTE